LPQTDTRDAIELNVDFKCLFQKIYQLDCSPNH
jgi:hypothetical protein